MRSLALVLALMLGLLVTAHAGTGFPDVKSSVDVYTLNNKVGANSVTFDSDAPMEKIHGTADGIQGTFRLDPSNLEDTKGGFVLEVRSMKTAITKRDEHMYSSKWLDADQYPQITFIFKGLSNVKASKKDGRYVATATANGNFKLHGMTSPIAADVMITFVPASKETAKRATGNLVMVTATFTVKLADHNIKGTGDIVGTKVGEEIKIEANLFANS